MWKGAGSCTRQAARVFWIGSGSLTEKVPLEAMLRRASRMAENMFECDGEVTAFWLAETAGGAAANYPDPDGRHAGVVRDRS